MKRIPFVLIAGALVVPELGAQEQRWILSYDRRVSLQVEMHGPNKPVVKPEQSRLTLVPKGDSVSGQLVKLATAEEPEWVIGEVRGVKNKDALTLRIHKPVEPMGFFATQWDAVMAWMKETMHGVSPTYTEMRLTMKGDSLTGTRSVITIDGATVDGPRAVTGRREAH
ncbi:MAG: hypothetical protein ABIR92_01365 [Gemmatimonadaceae bacterium]